MFKFIAVVFAALLAVAFGASKPQLVAAPAVAYSSPLVGGAPVVSAYGALPAVASYSAPLAYSAYAPPAVVY